ncbi:MAG TPA: hypothetical protein VLL76_03685 [Candidatus Omnitrophota bacterium]|nr:hypothetical protein [Candidatus Omnitrophota bacterium]
MADVFLKWWPVLVVVLNLFVLWVGWSMRKQFVTNDQFDVFQEKHSKEHDRLDEALARGEREFTLIKTELEHLPTREDLDGIKESLSDLTATMAGLKEAVDGIKKAVSGVQENFQTLIGHELAEARQAKGVKG